MAKKNPSYSEALKELNEILAGLESDTIDVDELSLQVKRAVELIKVCRGKIDSTEMEIKKIVEEFEKNNGKE
jgi:exodeoxyribonuclease VII small subunit